MSGNSQNHRTKRLLAVGAWATGLVAAFIFAGSAHAVYRSAHIATGKHQAAPLADKATPGEAKAHKAVAGRAIAGENAPALRIQRSSNKIKLRGVLPTEEDQKTLLGMIEASFPGFVIQNRTRVDAAARHTESWLSAVSFALRQLALMRDGNALLRENALSLRGVAETAESFEAVQKSVKLELPLGLVMDEFAVRPPSAAYVWLAQVEPGAVTISGHVPDAEAKRLLATLVHYLFPDARFEDATVVAKGAPDNWAEAASLSIRALRLLHSGSVSLSDQTLRIDGVPASSDAISQIEALNESLPEGFALENEVISALRAQAPSRSQRF